MYGKQLVVGLGEIGKAIQSILKCDGVDIEGITGRYDVLHICFPFSDKFKESVELLKIRHSCDFVIIHATVPIGTAFVLGAVSSPCRGIHPHLEEGIRTFVKFFGGKGAGKAACIFHDVGIKSDVSEDSQSVEAMKLWDTAQYGLNILLEKEIHRFCQENNLNFDTVYTIANSSYNAGYDKLGFPQFKKFVLQHKEGPIGGHCVVPNCDLLNSWVSDLIKEKQ